MLSFPARRCFNALIKKNGCNTCESEYPSAVLADALCAKSGLMHCTKTHLTAHDIAEIDIQMHTAPTELPQTASNFGSRVASSEATVTVLVFLT